MKQKRKTSTAKKQARAYRRRLARDMQKLPERLYGKTDAAAGKHICPKCMVAIVGEQCGCGHEIPPQPAKLEKTKGRVPTSHLNLSRPSDRQSAERIADALLGQSKPPRGLERINERHRPALRSWFEPSSQSKRAKAR